MKRIILIAFILGCILSCKKVEKNVIIQDVPIEVTLTEMVSQPDEVRLKFSHNGGASTVTGIVQANDSIALLKKIEGQDREMLALSSGSFSYTFKRSPESKKVYFAFYLEQDKIGKYTEIQSFTYADFRILEWGIDGDGVFKSVFSPENDFDVQYLFFNGFDSFDELRIFIDDIEVDYVSARGASPFLTFKIPESLASGNYTYRMTYQGNDIIYRKLFLPEGRLKLATTHPQNNEFPVAHYVFQNKLCFILFVHGDNNNKLEYASWDPSTSVWEQEGRFIEENTIPITGYFEGEELNGKIYFPPFAEYVNDEMGERRIYYMHSYDPVGKEWNKKPIKQIGNLRFGQSLTTESIVPYQDKLLVFLFGDDGSSLTNMHHVYEFDPQNNNFIKLGSIRLPDKAQSTKFLRDGDKFYIASSVEYYHPYYLTEYEVKIYQTDKDLSSLELLSTIPSSGYGSSAVIDGNHLYIYGAFQSGRLVSIVPFGAKMDLSSNEWTHLNPTYSSFGLFSSYSRQLSAVKGRLFDVGLSRGEVIEWDVNYRRRR